MQESEIKEKVIRNFEKKSGQFQVISARREWAKLKPVDIYNLLKQYSGKKRLIATSVLKLMTLKKWTIAATAHTGGMDSNAPLHITIRIKGQIAHHLNCKEKKLGRGLYIYEISQKPAGT